MTRLAAGYLFVCLPGACCRYWPHIYSSGLRAREIGKGHHITSMSSHFLLFFFLFLYIYTRCCSIFSFFQVGGFLSFYYYPSDGGDGRMLPMLYPTLLPLRAAPVFFTSPLKLKEEREREGKRGKGRG